MTYLDERFLGVAYPLDGTHFSKNRPFSDKALHPQADHACFMLTEIYIEALLVDEELADQVWEAWDAGVIGDLPAFLVWWCIGDSANIDR